MHIVILQAFPVLTHTHTLIYTQHYLQAGAFWMKSKIELKVIKSNKTQYCIYDDDDVALPACDTPWYSIPLFISETSKRSCVVHRNFIHTHTHSRLHTYAALRAANDRVTFTRARFSKLEDGSGGAATQPCRRSSPGHRRRHRLSYTNRGIQTSPGRRAAGDDGFKRFKTHSGITSYIRCWW